MKRYMLHLKNSHDLNRKMAKDTLRKSRIITSGMNLTLRDCRVSKKYIEFDTTISESDLDELIDKLSLIGPLDHAKHVVEQNIEKEKAISEGIDYFNNERFWECHETLEGVWKNCDGNEKFLVQGLILVAAGLVHYQKDEDSICINIFNRALEKLENSSGKYHDIDIDNIKKIVTKMINSKSVSSFLI